MIRFNKGQSNSIVVTLTENSTVSDPIYLFKFVNQQSMVEYYFTSPDLSQFKERYNLFTVTEKLNPDTLNGEVSLGNEGFYDYYVYQTSLNSLSGLTEASEMVPYIVKEVENGLVWVVPEAVVNSIYTPQDSPIIVYHNEGE